MIINKDNIDKFITDNVMDCSNRDITHIESIPNHIKFLICSNNKLTELPKLPENLKGLNCDYNQLTQLPKLPNGLSHLYCDYNQLTTLPILPESLKLLHLNCSDNPLPYSVTLDTIKEHNNRIKLLKRTETIKTLLNDNQ